MTDLEGSRAARLATFFTQFRDLRRPEAEAEAALPTRLAGLFTRLRPLLAGELTAAAAPRSAAADIVLDESRLRALFAQLTGPLEQARRDGSLADVWDIAGLGRNELRTAAALAALWNPRLCGTVAVEFLAAFLARVGPDENFPTHTELNAGYVVRTEDHPEGEVSERVDITIEGRGFLLGIEIKIDADEGPQQLSRYRNALQARAAHRQQRPALIYLSPRPPLDPFTRHARWSDIAAAARSVAPCQAAERQFVHQLVTQFATHVAAF